MRVPKTRSNGLPFRTADIPFPNGEAVRTARNGLPVPILAVPRSRLARNGQTGGRSAVSPFSGRYPGKPGGRSERPDGRRRRERPETASPGENGEAERRPMFQNKNADFPENKREAENRILRLTASRFRNGILYVPNGEAVRTQSV